MIANRGTAWLAAGLLGLAGCGNGGSAVETRERETPGAEATLTRLRPCCFPTYIASSAREMS